MTSRAYGKSTKADLEAAFKEQYATDEAPANATFLIYDQNFIRGDTMENGGRQQRAYMGLCQCAAYLFIPPTLTTLTTLATVPYPATITWPTTRAIPQR